MDAATLLERARQDGTPVIDGATAHFLWQGEAPPILRGDINWWDDLGIITLQEAGPGLWLHSETLPPDAYIEYVFQQGEERLLDPLNPRTVYNGIDADQNWFTMPGYVPTPLTERQRGVPRGKVTRHVIRHPFLLVGGRRDVYLYQPPVDGPVPLLVVYDGRDYKDRASLPALVDNLIAQGRIRPLALAMIQHGKQARFIEYAAGDSTLGLLLEVVLPLARRELNLLDVTQQPGAFGVLGASMGGLMALYTGLRLPHIFGRVLSQSGAFELPGDIPGIDAVTFDLVRAGQARDLLNLWLDCGSFEWLVESNRRMRDLLAAQGYHFAYHEYNAGHNYPAWRDDLPAGLTALFGP